MHVKTLRSQKLRMLLIHRKLLQSKAIAIENDLRGTLRNFGLKVGMAGTVKFETRIKELVGNSPRAGCAGRTAACRPAGASRAVCVILHRRLLAIVRDDGVCQRPNDDPRRRSCGGTDLLGPPSTCPLGFENPSQSVPCLD